MRTFDVERNAGKGAETEDQMIERLLGDTIDNRHTVVVAEYPATTRQSQSEQQQFGS